MVRLGTPRANTVSPVAFAAPFCVATNDVQPIFMPDPGEVRIALLERQLGELTERETD